MSNRLLVTGGAIGDLEIITAAKELGYFVITSGNRPNDPGHKISDAYVPCDYTDTKGLLEICESYQVEIIVPSAHDLAAVAAANVAFELGLAGYDKPEISSQIHDKSSLRELWSATGGNVPRFISSSNFFKLYFRSIHLKKPVIVKPTNLTGGTGISIARNNFSLLLALRRAFFQTKSRRVIVEEYLEGTNHGLTCLLKNQKIVFCANDDEFHVYDNFRVSATTFPSKHTITEIYQLISEIETFAKEMKLVDGIFHTQYLMTGRGPLLLEACRRTPGDAYTKFVSLAYGFNYATDILLGFAGKPPQAYKNMKSVENSYHVGRFVLMPLESGTFSEIQDPSFSNLLWVSNFRQPGDQITDARSWTARIYIFKSQNEELNEDFYRQRALESKVILK